MNPVAQANGQCEAFSIEYSSGLTKREYFAAKAMSGLLGRGEQITGVTFEEILHRVAQVSVKYADALLAALEQKDLTPGHQSG